jgi:O-methyltransferase
MSLKDVLRPLVRRISRSGAEQGPDLTITSTFDESERALVLEARPYSLLSPERLVANIDAVDYLVRRGVPGAIVECGVWRGGSVLVMIKTLLRHSVTDRDVYLFDTFEGMTLPSETDTSRFDGSALGTWQSAEQEGRKPWDEFFRPETFSLDKVKEVIAATGYPSDRVHFVVGKVEETLPARAPDEIALLRLDTDWYESTKHELEHLYPKIVPGGVLVVDDYGHWDGCRRAVDEYFSTSAPPVLLARSDYTGRIAIKH